MIRMYVSHHLVVLLPSSYSRSFLLPDVVTWLAPTCDVVNTSSAPTAFRRLRYWLILVPFPLSMPSPALFTTISYGWVRGHRSITSPPWAAYDCMAFCSMVCQDTSPLLSLLLELLSVWAKCILAEGVLLKCVANGLHRGINMEMNVVPSRIFVVSEETLWLVWILIFIRFSKHSEEDVWTVAVLLFS